MYKKGSVCSNLLLSFATKANLKATRHNKAAVKVINYLLGLALTVFVAEATFPIVALPAGAGVTTGLGLGTVVAGLAAAAGKMLQNCLITVFMTYKLASAFRHLGN